MSAGSTTTEQPPLEVLDPASGEPIATVPDMAAADVAPAFARAREAQPAWEALGPDGRGEILHRARRWVIANAPRIVESVVAETGKPRDEAVLSEIGHPAAAFGYWADVAAAALADEEISSASPFLAGKRLVARHLPVGVVGVIGPWNFPFTNSVCDCIPALAAGNAVVLKPSEVTPLTPMLIAEGLRECGMPEHVFTVVTGGPQTGEAVVDEADHVMFTGSRRTGRKIMERAARTLTPVSLELGGKDPMIVLDDADLERAANYAVFSGVQNAGQVCISTERIYVEDRVYDEFVEKVVEKVSALRQGPAAADGAYDLGPMIHAPQADIVAAHIADAISRGARALVGGGVVERDGARYVEPTVLVDVDHTMLAMREETFGPTLPIVRVADEEEAVRLANDSDYGLGASVFTRDAARGEVVARRIEAGGVCVNDAQVNFLALEMPMAGWKSSGVGFRHGPEGLRKYTRSQAIVVTPEGPEREAFMFPYDAEVTTQILALLRDVYGS